MTTSTSQVISVLFRNTAIRVSGFNQAAFRLLRKPRVVLYWLGKAHWAQLVLLAVLVTFPVQMPKYVDSTLEKFYEPVSKKFLFGLIEAKRQHPKLAERQRQFKLAIWSSGIGIVLLLLWLEVPKALKRAERRAKKYEDKADERLGTQPSHSILLYRSALAMASDPDHEDTIISKLDKLDWQLSQVANTHRSYSQAQQTFVLSEDERNEQEQQTEVSGDRYKIETELGRGAMGTVYSAHDTLLERCVAIKELAIHLTDNQQLRERFQQEAKALARLTHPHIVQVYDFTVEKNSTCIVMEFVDSLSLEEYLKVNTKFSIEKTISLGNKFADALSYAHERGVVHRDFKPANVLLTKELTPKITDFGLAKITKSSIDTQTGTIMGSPAYMSPEQALGDSSDERSDIYSLGITLYKMITGKLPFEGMAADVMAKQINCIPSSPREIDETLPKNISDLIMMMLAKEPENRIQTMTRVSRLLIQSAKRDQSETKGSSL